MKAVKAMKIASFVLAIGSSVLINVAKIMVVNEQE